MTRWLIQHDHGPELSGVKTYVAALARELERRGHEVHVISTRDTSIKEIRKHVRWAEVVHLNSSNFAVSFWSCAMRRPVVIKYHWPFWLSAVREFRRMGLLRRFAHELSFIVRTQTKSRGPMGIPRALGRLIGRAVVFRMATSRIAVSDHLIRTFEMPDRVHKVVNPIDVYGEPTVAKEDLLCFAGRVTYLKGADTAIRAFAAAGGADPACSFRLVVVGDGDQLEELPAVAEEAGVATRVDFIGSVRNDEARRWMARSRALLYPIRWEDPAPYVPLEAAVSGTVTIGYALGGVPETATPIGLLVGANCFGDLVSALENGMKDPPLLEKLGQEARENAIRTYGARAAVDQLAAAFPVGFH